MVEPAGASEDEVLIEGVGISCHEKALLPESSVISTIFEDGTSAFNGIRKVPEAFPDPSEITVATRRYSDPYVTVIGESEENTLARN